MTKSGRYDFMSSKTKTEEVEQQCKMKLKTNGCTKEGKPKDEERKTKLKTKFGAIVTTKGSNDHIWPVAEDEQTHRER